MTTTIFHNPACGTSRTTLALIRDAGIEPVVVPYLDVPPTLDTLRELAAAVGTGARSLLRAKEPLFAQLDLASAHWTDDELLGFIVQHPILLNRPVVVSPLGARVCRPADTVHDLLPGRPA